MRYLLCILLLQISTLGQTQTSSHEYLVQFSSIKAAAAWQSKNSAEYQLEPLVLDWQIYLLKPYDDLTNLEALEQHPDILHIQINHLLNWRKTPNDLEYDQWQWNLDTLGLPEAWNYTTGGMAAADTIVVAVIDGGCDINHEDLQPNIWYNYQEIPNDSIDNDENGYVDDFRGWQILNNNDQHALDGHGSSVAGIIGGVGNNELGISGINWQIKMMILSAGQPDLVYESNIIKAYAYVLKMRQLYEQSNGTKGAYIVATNLSAGVDFAEAEDFPLWCAIYDSLGQAGILSVGAVMNRREDIDQVGDMPSTCISDYLLTVTNSTKYDALNQNAGYGVQHVDISAPGAVYTTRTNNNYNVFGGSSGAAPHAAGAIALLASLPNTHWQAMLHQYPAKAILQIKSILLATASPKLDMQDRIRSGGRLDVGAAMQLLNALYSEADGLNLRVFTQYNQWFLQFFPEEPGTYQWEIYDLLGRLRYQSTFSIHTRRMQTIALDWDGGAKEMLILRLRKGKKQIAVQKFLAF